MGTNFYIIEDGKEQHIGKRSAAGRYCHDCGVTLCRGGAGFVHSAIGSWFSHCPKCGNTPNNDPGAADIELGFVEAKDVKLSGVGSASSFTWADFFPYEFHQFVKEHPWCTIRDEYGREMSYARFVLDVLNKCPIVFYDSIGEEFS